MNLAQVAEQRVHPRTEVSWPVVMLTAEGDLDGMIENISAGGAYISCAQLLFRNDILIMAILGLDGEPMWVGAEVVRADITLVPDSESVPIGMGVRFTYISAADLQLLSDTVSEQITLA
jgi:hypothetical protein